MKRFINESLMYAKNRIFNFPLAYILILVFGFLPGLSKAQNLHDIVPILECVEDLGGGTYRANFGYLNPNSVTITVDPQKSFLVYNGAGKKTPAVNVFKPGRHSYVFSRTFSFKDRLRWHLILPKGKVKMTLATSGSKECSGTGVIIPYYPPPAGGRLEFSVIGPELTALHQKYSATGSAESDDVFQIDAAGERVLARFIAREGYFQLLTDLLSQTGNEIVLVSSDEGSLTITGYYPIANLLILNNYPDLINYARPVYPAINTDVLIKNER